MGTLELAYQGLYLLALTVVGGGLVFALIRAIRGPRMADRVLGVNMAGTMTILALALLAYVLKMEAVLDVCLVYCLASFLSVVVLSKVYVTVHREKVEAQKRAPRVSEEKRSDADA